MLKLQSELSSHYLLRAITSSSRDFTPLSLRIFMHPALCLKGGSTVISVLQRDSQCTERVSDLPKVPHVLSDWEDWSLWYLSVTVPILVCCSTLCPVLVGINTVRGVLCILVEVSCCFKQYEEWVFQCTLVKYHHSSILNNLDNLHWMLLLRKERQSIVIEDITVLHTWWRKKD